VSDIILGRSGEVISRESQKALIAQYAKENDVEVVAWFEDEVYAENILARPGIKSLLACELPAEMILVERTWCLSRKWEELSGFLQTAEERGRRVESATMLWDCCSQQARWFYRKTGPKAPARACPVLAAAKAPARAVTKPAAFHFVGLKRAPARA
jgi:hypothetical protein